MDPMGYPLRKLTWPWKIHHEWRCNMYFPLKMGMFQLVMLVFRGVLSNKSIFSKSTFVLMVISVSDGCCLECVHPGKLGIKLWWHPLFVVTHGCVVFQIGREKTRPPASLFWENSVCACFEVMFSFCNFLSWDSSPVGRNLFGPFFVQRSKVAKESKQFLTW